MLRLNSNLLPEVLSDPYHLTIALLNVRSLAADKNLRSASILCFCETWLNASQPTPVLLHDQIDIRCDRMTCANKGGVLMCVPSQLNPTNVHRFATSGIETVSATVQLPNGENWQIAVVYRSPSVPQATLITLLTRLFTHVTLCTAPWAISMKMFYIAKTQPL